MVKRKKQISQREQMKVYLAPILAELNRVARRYGEPRTVRGVNQWLKATRERRRAEQEIVRAQRTIETLRARLES